MNDSTVTISRSIVEKLLEDLADLQIEYRRYDAQVASIFYELQVCKQEIRPQTVMANDLPEDASELEHKLLALCAAPTDWVSVHHAMELDEGLATLGYENAEGIYVERPEYTPVPAFTTKIEAAIKLKDYVFKDVMLRMVEVESDGFFGNGFRVELFDGAGNCSGSYTSIFPVYAVLGAIWTVLLICPDIELRWVKLVD